jgi:hypothetical protein
MVSCMRYIRYLRNFISLEVFCRGILCVPPSRTFANLAVKSSLGAMAYSIEQFRVDGPSRAKSQSTIRSIDETCCGAPSKLPGIRLAAS